MSVRMGADVKRVKPAAEAPTPSAAAPSIRCLWTLFSLKMNSLEMLDKNTNSAGKQVHLAVFLFQSSALLLADFIRGFKGFMSVH